jgi:hypothetical protein
MPLRILSAAVILIPVLLSGQPAREGLRIAFYNVENLFDPFEDSLATDEEFGPGGIRGWTWERFESKLDRIHKVLVALGGWKPPELVGLCEVENYFVLHRLVRETALKKFEYRIIHRDSPDERGMDVALLYRPGSFHPELIRCYPVTVPDPDPDPTRDILYVKGVLKEGQMLHLFVIHWPSRWGGTLASQSKRMAAAAVLRQCLDSIYKVELRPRILVAGDFNDELSNSSLRDGLGVKSGSETCPDRGLYFPQSKSAANYPGSHKYRGRWYGFDLILVSRALLNDPALQVHPDGFRIFAPGFLLEDDPVWLGKRPIRTYRGYRYMGGFSDHLPVYLDLVSVDQK